MKILIATQILGRAMTVNAVRLAIHVGKKKEIAISMENVLEILNVVQIIVDQSFRRMLIAVLLHEIQKMNAHTRMQ